MQELCLKGIHFFSHLKMGTASFILKEKNPQPNATRNKTTHNQAFTHCPRGTLIPCAAQGKRCCTMHPSKRGMPTLTSQPWWSFQTRVGFLKANWEAALQPTSRWIRGSSPFLLALSPPLPDGLKLAIQTRDSRGLFVDSQPSI